MNKKLCILLTLVLVLTFILTVFCGCGGTNEPEYKEDIEDMPVTTDKPENTITEPTEHFATRVLHKVNVTESTLPFIVDGETDYKIIYTDSLQNRKAAAFVARHLRIVTGATVYIEVYDEQTYSASSKYIVLDVPELFVAAGGQMPADDIGQTGYYIKSIDNSVFINTLTDSGAQLACISFLYHTIGFRQYSADTIVYTKSGATLPTMDIIERPDFDFYVTSNRITTDGAYGMGFSENLFIPIGTPAETWHNTMNYIPPEEYKSAHPYWYADCNGDEICYTTRGDADEFAALTQLMAEKVLYYANEFPTRPYITITIEDATRSCTCNACSQSRATYGCDSAALVKFMNAIDDIVQAELQKVADQNGTTKRELYLLFFAYNNMEKAPVVKNADGSYSPKDESVICNDNVGVYIAPIYAAYNQSFYHDNNQGAKQTIDGWKVCSKNMYMWLYETNYSHYLYPLNSWDTMIETYRYCQISGAKYMFPEGQYNQAAVTHFSRLKEYFNAQACFNVNLNYEDIVDDFFTNYFKEAAKPMRQFFDELQAHLRYLEIAYPAQVNGNIYNNMERQEYWPKQLLEGWLKLCDQAYDAIAIHKDTDPELYKVLYNHINLETLFPRFALLRLHEGSYSAMTLREMQIAFRDDCRSFSISNVSEIGSIEQVFADWGLL